MKKYFLAFMCTASVFLLLWGLDFVVRGFDYPSLTSFEALGAGILFSQFKNYFEEHFS